MGSVRKWAGAAACLGVMVMAGAGLAPVRLSAQQREGATAPAGLAGNVARGKYIVESVAMCGECHSTRDQAGDIVSGTRYLGGPLPARVPWPADWPLQVPRIAGLPGYSDSEALRLLTEGAIRRNGILARAPMPRFRMTSQDAADVIAFLRAQ